MAPLAECKVGMLKVPQAKGVAESEHVIAQSTPAFVGSLLTTGVNSIPLVLPTATVVVDGAGLSAIDMAAWAVWLDEVLLLLLHPIEKQSAVMTRYI